MGTAVRAAVVVVGTLCLLGTTPVPGMAAPSERACDRDSWTAGTVDLCDGALVYRDYVYDDYGAAGALPVGGFLATTAPLSPTAGTARYPEGAESTADLVDLTLELSGDQLEVTFELNALHEPDQTIAALAIDADHDATTGGGDWPGLGIRSDGWEVLEVFTAGDPDTNTITGTLPAPAGARWRVQAVTAQADGTVMNAAFRGSDEQIGVAQGNGTWWEGRQAQVLASGDVTPFGHTVDVADLRDGTTRPASVAPGLHQRVYTSDHTLGSGEGMTYSPVRGRHGDTDSACEQGFHTLGRYQPYGIYVPPDAPEPAGLQVVLHGCSANHASQIELPGLRQRYGDDSGRVVVTPLGRGPYGFYSDISERDVLDVVADAEDAYRIDADRRFVSGYSMGGYGALRFASLYPHLWAGLTNWVGHTGDSSNNPVGEFPMQLPAGAVGNVIDLVGNLEHVPGAHLYAGADELVQVWQASALQQALDGAEVPYELFLHPAAEHLTLYALDDWTKEADASRGLTRGVDPSHVRYRTDLSLAYPEYGIIHDTAYWLSGIRNRTDGYTAVEATTHACGGHTPTYTTGSDAGTDPVPWTSTFRRRTGTEHLEPADRLVLEGTNLAAVEVDVEATCLAGRAVDYEVTTDGPLTLALSDGRMVEVEAVGTVTGTLSAPASADPSRSGTTLAAPAGPSPATPTTPSTGTRPLPTLAGLVLVLVAATRRGRAPDGT